MSTWSTESKTFAASDRILKEDGGYLLLENGGGITLEQWVAALLSWAVPNKSSATFSTESKNSSTFSTENKN